ncbi:hypothetical protein RhiirC2_797908 [Rhizophagus irregularis]|uniref:Uncharacterized protein n=1 Tax=Rhizophagus irregularis TaxID=588596 RepID=A0A2N1M798_9GLOM|nr:hypothetical protein RhiirC2_797908 [Rhizophagus irregularis]
MVFGILAFRENVHFGIMGFGILASGKEFDNGMTTILQQSLSGKQPIHFMPTEVSDDIKGYFFYILRITGSLINGQKVVVNITGI